MTGDEKRRLFSWALGVMATVATLASSLVTFRDLINWPAAVGAAINILTFAQILVTAMLSVYFVSYNRRPLHVAFARFFAIYAVASVWALLTDLVPALSQRNIRSLVYRALVVGNCLTLLVAVLTWAKPEDSASASTEELDEQRRQD